MCTVCTLKGQILVIQHCGCVRLLCPPLLMPILIGADSIREAIQVRRELQQLVELGGFTGKYQYVLKGIFGLARIPKDMKT